MVVLSSKQVLQENDTSDPNSIAVLALTYKALSDVSCLSEFKNIQRLDLSFNSLTSLEGLKSCLNLKWLSVAQNKLQSLKGIEGLIKLTVLNAGKNKLKSMDELNSLVSLRALILNDNEIISICKLDQMKELNTLVLSRNPIREIGMSLAKRNSISKLSLSNCQLQHIGSSLKSCTELKELRLSHNEITTLPSELACNKKLQNVDLGNNGILRWSDLEVLSSLVNLKNLNLLGNPIAEKEGLAKKIQKLVPNVVIFNTKPVNKILKKRELENEGDHPRKNSRKHNLQTENEGFLPDTIGDWDAAKESKPKKKKRSEMQEETLDHKDDRDARKESKQKNKKKSENIEGKTSDHKKNINSEIEAMSGTRKTPKHKKPVFDDGETPFMDLFVDDTTVNSLSSGDQGTSQSVDKIAGLVTSAKKKRQNKKPNIGSASLQLLTAIDEVGLGGPSMWDE